MRIRSRRCVATMIVVPAAATRLAMEMILIGLVDLLEAQRIDASTPDD